MNSKFIMGFFIVMNVLTLVFSFGCSSAGSSCSMDDNGFVISNFFFIDPLADMTKAGTPTVNETLQDEMGSLLSPQPAGAKVTEGFSLFLDGLKMLLGVAVFLTPIPIIDLMGSFGMPLMINVMILPFLFFAWIIGVAELIRGGALGK